MTQAYHADSSDLARKEVLTWELFGTASRELAQTIADSDFEPEIIIAVARGGLLPAGALSCAFAARAVDDRSSAAAARRARWVLVMRSSSLDGDGNGKGPASCARTGLVSSRKAPFGAACRGVDIA